MKTITLDCFTVTAVVVEIATDIMHQISLLRNDQCSTDFESMLTYTKHILHSVSHMRRQMGGKRKENKLFLFVFNKIWPTGFM